MGKLTSSIDLNSTDWTSGACHSYQPEDTDAIVNPALVQTSNGEINAQSGISKLPVELLSLIFRHCDSQIRARLILTHTCQRWRLIAIHNPSLWTHIRLITGSVGSEALCKRFKSLLCMQLDRSGELLLDVVWYSDFRNPYSICALLAIRDKAPFYRWRSLRVYVRGLNPLADSLFPSTAELINLQSLVILGGTEMTFAELFCQATTSKLQMLDLSSCSHDGTEDRLIKSLNAGASCPPNLSGKVAPFLLDSIITLRAGSRAKHPFPNILNYELKRCTFISKETIDLRSVTSLIINGRLTIHTECDVSLPALQYLQLMGMTICPKGKIEAPALETLHLATAGPHPAYVDYTRHPSNSPGYMDHTINSPGYRLSPKRLIVLESSLSSQMIIELLAKSPKVTEMTLRFNVGTDAEEVISKLYETSSENTSENELLCPRLAELILVCHWSPHLTQIWAKRWLSGLESRRDASRIRISTKASMSGEKTYLGEW